MKVRWLDRRISAPGPYLALCLSQDEFDAAKRALGVKQHIDYIKNEQSHATTHFLTNEAGAACCIVCMRGYEGRDPIEVAGLLVHEAVHIWQDYADSVGEASPGIEQEAYAVQAISQELMSEFARRAGEIDGKAVQRKKG